MIWVGTCLQGKIVKVEERSIGSVELSVYRAYITAWGPIWLPIAIFGTAIAERLTGIGQNYWLKVRKILALMEAMLF